MQFHLNGFRTGDPAMAEPADGVATTSDRDVLATSVNVLIVGCGPAGLVLAAQLARFPEISTCIVDRRPGPLQLGQADGIACRTMEMFEAFGFSDRVMKEGYWVNETSFWKPDPDRSGAIARSGRIEDAEEGLSEFPHMILNQARVHDFLLDEMTHAPRRLVPHYARELKDLEFDGEDGMQATFERGGDGHSGEVETIRARYVVGCDGARSKVRQSIGRELRGDATNQAWGVMDVLAITDFPDIRLKAAVHSSGEGSLLIIPREGGYLVRLYIELDRLNENERVSSRNITIDQLIAAAGRILRPYTLDVKEVAWWSVYEIGQRLCDKFDDVPHAEMATRLPRVFIAGDACHTHSPKAGQGMNVSMRDSFNLGWKLAAVLLGRAEPAILHSYSAERQGVAQTLIEFDRAFARMFSARPKTSENDEDGVDPAEFQKYFVQQGRFTAGTAIQYAPSIITGVADHQDLAEGFPIGMRFHSAPVIRLADARPLHLGHVVKADGRWRIFAFADADGLAGGLGRLCRYLAEDATSPLRRYTQAGNDIDAILDLRAVLQDGHRDVAFGDLPPLLRPSKGRHGLTDYEKAFCVDGRQDIFDLRGIDRRRGAMVVVRPDQHVGHVLPLGAGAALEAFFAGFLRPAG